MQPLYREKIGARLRGAARQAEMMTAFRHRHCVRVCGLLQRDPLPASKRLLAPTTEQLTSLADLQNCWRILYTMSRTNYTLPRGQYALISNLTTPESVSQATRTWTPAELQHAAGEAGAILSRSSDSAVPKSQVQQHMLGLLDLAWIRQAEINEQAGSSGYTVSHCSRPAGS